MKLKNKKSKNIILKEDISKNQILKEDISKNQILKEDISKNQILKEDISKNQILKEDISKELILSSLKKNIKINYIFYISIIICLYILSKNNITKPFFCSLVTVIFISFFGYIVHVISHNIYSINIYNNSNNLLKFYPILDNIILKSLRFVDFHPTTHHNSNINSQLKNIVLEFINNLFTQGINLIIVLKFLQYIDIKIVVLWAFLYASVHNINFFFVKPTTHRDHHLDSSTNFGLDIYDILFGTKYDWNDIENYNHGAINMIIITIIILYLSFK